MSGEQPTDWVRSLTDKSATKQADLQRLLVESPPSGDVDGTEGEGDAHDGEQPVAAKSSPTPSPKSIDQGPRGKALTVKPPDDWPEKLRDRLITSSGGSSWQDV